MNLTLTYWVTVAKLKEDEDKSYLHNSYVDVYLVALALNSFVIRYRFNCSAGLIIAKIHKVYGSVFTTHLLCKYLTLSVLGAINAAIMKEL